MSVGGARPGAGRKVGSVSQRSAELLSEAMASGKSPVEYMLEIMRDDQQDQKRRDWAAEKAAPYVHPRLAPEARRVELQLPDTSSIEGIKQATRTILQASVTGELTPSEAQALSSIVEAQRKAIETEDLLNRIEKLEAEAASRGRQ